MAQFKLTPEEYRRLHHERIGRSWKSYAAWVVSFAALLGGLIIGQYAFAVLWGSLLLFLYISIYRFGPKVRAYHLASPFALGPFDLELRPDSYTLRVGSSTLNLHLNEFRHAHDLGEYVRLDHACGCLVYVPKRQLTAEDATIVESYRQRFPGLPERRFPW